MRYVKRRTTHNKSDNRVLRGGSWINNAGNCRSAYRNRNEPSNRNNNVGFRFAQLNRLVDAKWSTSVLS